MKPKTQMTIVLGTFNGAAYLQDQLQSLIGQTFEDWNLLISDDGSTDETLDIVKEFSRQNPSKQVTVISGPCHGVAQNFLAALMHESCDGNMVAFCDQDDVWLPHKLEAAVKVLQQEPSDVPVVYASAVRVVDQALNTLRETQVPEGKIAFGNLLVENMITGNTMVMNSAAAKLITHSPNVPFHDWWVLQVVSGVGGKIICDPQPSVLYRQHSQNVVGHAVGLVKKQSNVKAIVRNVYGANVFRNARCLEESKLVLTAENQRILAALGAVMRNRFRAFTLPAKGVRRRGVFATVVMCIALFNGGGHEHK